MMPAPLFSLGETRFKPLQVSITDALRRCGSTTWDGNRSADGHTRGWHRSLGMWKTSFFVFKDRAFCRFSTGVFLLFRIPSRTRTCSHQERLTGLSANFGWIFLDGCWVDSRAACFAVYDKSWCRRLQV